MAGSSLATVCPSQCGGVAAEGSREPAEVREQAVKFVVIADDRVVYSSANIGEAWAYRNGWGVADSALAVVIAQPGEALPVDVSDGPSE